MSTFSVLRPNNTVINLFRVRNAAEKVSQCGWVLQIYNPASAMLLLPVVLQGEGRARTDYRNNGKSPVGSALLGDLV